MQLLTHDQRDTMLANGRRYQADPDFEPLPVVKLFTPWAACTWLLTDLDPDDHDIASGLCDLGFGEPEIGSVRITEIESLRGSGGLRAERCKLYRERNHQRLCVARTHRRANHRLI